MKYALGIDLGTTYSAAAISTKEAVEIFALGPRAATIPSIVAVREHGEVLVGEAAERRALIEPARAAREFKRRLGDPTPIFLGGVPYGAESLTAHLLRAIVESVVERQGEPPSRIAITHPATYRDFKLDLLRLAVGQADVGEVTFISEPEAAAVHYASQDRFEDGDVVAVYDFGGGTFDATVVRRRGPDFELVGVPEGMERIGGVDFDEALLAHVDEALGGALSALDANDPATRAALARLRDECRLAKEALSSDTDVSIPVALPGLNTEVRVTRSGFESLIRPRVTETIEALQRAVRSAGVAMDDVARVLLVGGTSHIPLVRQLVREATGRPVALDAHPKHSVSLGAAQLVRPVSTAPSVTAPVPPVGDTPTVESAPRSTRLLVSLLVLLVVVAGAVAFALTRGDGSGRDAAAAETGVSESEPTSPAADVGATTTAVPGNPTSPTPVAAFFGDVELKLGSPDLQGSSLALPVTLVNTLGTKQLSLSGVDYGLTLGDGSSITGVDQNNTLVLEAGSSNDLAVIFGVAEGVTLSGASFTMGAAGKESLSVPLDGGASSPTLFRVLGAKGTASFDTPVTTMTFSLDDALLSLDQELEQDAVTQRVADRRAPQGSTFLSISLHVTAGACQCPGGVNWSSSDVRLTADGVTVEPWTSASGVVGPGETAQFKAGFIVPGTAKAVVLIAGPNVGDDPSRELTIDLGS